MDLSVYKQIRIVTRFHDIQAFLPSEWEQVSRTKKKSKPSTVLGMLMQFLRDIWVLRKTESNSKFRGDSEPSSGYLYCQRSSRTSR